MLDEPKERLRGRLRLVPPDSVATATVHFPNIKQGRERDRGLVALPGSPHIDNQNIFCKDHHHDEIKASDPVVKDLISTENNCRKKK